MHGISLNKTGKDAALASTLRTDDMERFSVVPKTVMINAWQPDMQWIVVDHIYPHQIQRRLLLLQEKQEMVMGRLPDPRVSAAEQELRDMVVRYVLDTYPRYFQRQKDIVASALTGLAVDVGSSGADALVAVALLASEDMLLLLPESDGASQKPVYRVKSGALLFPNDWSLRSHFNQPQPKPDDSAAMEAWRQARDRSQNAARLGKSPYEIHDGRVPYYMEQFAERVDLFFSQMTPEMRVWRRNWAVRMTDELFLHADALPDRLPAMNAQNWAEYGYLRSEQQTFTRLPQSGAIVFSIKTYLWKLSELVKNPVALKALVTADANLASKMSEYRRDSLPTFREFLDRYRH